MTTLDKMVDDDLIALKKTINYIFKQNVTADRNLMDGVFLRYIVRCIAIKKPIQHNITYYLYTHLPPIFHKNTYKEIVCYAVNKYFPNNDVILFEKFLIDNNAKEKYVNNTFNYIPTDTQSQLYFLQHPLGTSDFWFDLHMKWVEKLAYNRIHSRQYSEDYLSILLNKYAKMQTKHIKGLSK